MNCRSLLRVLALAVTLQTATAGAADDQAIRAAAEAFRAGDRVRLAALAAETRGHVVAPYVEYWQLQLRLEEAAPAELSDFLSRHAGSQLAERLRGEWLKKLGQRQEWELFDREYPKLSSPDAEIACYALQRRHSRGDPLALEAVRESWLDIDLPQACMPLADVLVASGRLTVEDIWQRMRRLMEARRIGPTVLTAACLPAAQAPDAKILERIGDGPLAYLKKLKPDFAASRSGRELALFALARLTRQDPDAAAAWFETRRDRFSAVERAYFYGQLGWQAAMRHHPQAVAWYRAAGYTPMVDEQIAWKARSALRAQNWRLLQTIIEEMPARISALPDWVYWRGRALQARGQPEAAEPLFRSIAGTPTFYGNLADDELGRPIAIPPRAAKPTEQEIQEVADDASIARSVSLFRLGMRPEAVREWNWGLRGSGDRTLLAAAEYARRNQIYDRAVTSADRTREEHDYDLRYLAPFRDKVGPRARELALDPAWVFGLMRQESRFVMDARSAAGARGLMQVMPSTANWVARKMGMKDFVTAHMEELDTNVYLGTSYLKMVLENLDNHPVLASAAYNAGPGRARRWRDSRSLEGAIYIETIPFSETRDYVKKVMSNAIYYSALFEGKPQSLKARLGVIRPAGEAEDAAIKVEELP
jgi:soluble lytic murein transglycosylase